MQKSNLVFALTQFSGGDFHCAIKEYSEDYSKLKANLIKTFLLNPLTEIIRAMDESFGKDYYTLKDMLTEKYGTPECVEQFSDREPSSDFLKFHAILNDECHYVSEFSCENGKIQLTMSKQDYNSAAVILRYIDKVNADETRKKVMDDL